LTVTAEEGAEITVKLGETEQNAGLDDKYTMTWETGENVVTVTVSDGTDSTDYTITVTAS
ncbi:MAG: cadherin-like beta sandwich domain-containing protein, partial [Clostridia bacterium]|nr:cadherin-like beta sandwich domain-containing protein [Clostridia bacterium]